MQKHGSQLFRYFGVTCAKFGILTNGIVYQFYTDLDESNKMDAKPFLEFDFSKIKESLIPELQKFCKNVFDYDKIVSTASNLKYTSLIKDKISSEMSIPSDDMVKLLLTGVYEGQKNHRVLEKFRQVVKDSFSSIINETVNQKISYALNQGDASEEQQKDSPDGSSEEILADTNTDSKIITTENEIQAFYIVRGLLAEICPVDRIVYRDVQRYFSVLLDDNNRKPICRLDLNSKQFRLYVPNENKSFIKYDIINDICKYKSDLIDAAKRYL